MLLIAAVYYLFCPLLLVLTFCDLIKIACEPKVDAGSKFVKANVVVAREKDTEEEGNVMEARSPDMTTETMSKEAKKKRMRELWASILAEALTRGILYHYAPNDETDSSESDDEASESDDEAFYEND